MSLFMASAGCNRLGCNVVSKHIDTVTTSRVHTFFKVSERYELMAYIRDDLVREPVESVGRVLAHGLFSIRTL